MKMVLIFSFNSQQDSEWVYVPKFQTLSLRLISTTFDIITFFNHVLLSRNDILVKIRLNIFIMIEDQ